MCLHVHVPTILNVPINTHTYTYTHVCTCTVHVCYTLSLVSARVDDLLISVTNSLYGCTLGTHISLIIIIHVYHLPLPTHYYMYLRG